MAHLKKYSVFRKRVEEILNVAFDLTESLNLVDDAEGALIENTSSNGEALQAWASSKDIKQPLNLKKT